MEPRVDQYAICVDTYYNNKVLDDFLKTSVGVFFEKVKSPSDGNDEYFFIFKNIPEDVYQFMDTSNNSFAFWKEEIIHLADTEEELQMYIDAEKFKI